MWSGVLKAGESQLEESPEVMRWQFFRGLRASKLLPAEDVDRLEQEGQGVALEELLQHLIDQGTLTPYQVRRIRDGAPTGLVLAQYKVLDEIGGGGFGQVYKASHAVMNRVVALKLMTPDRCRSRLFRDVFYREVAAVTRLGHPNVVLTFDANETDGVLFLAMEYIEGASLHQYVTDAGPPDVSVAVSIMLQLASGLAHVHEAGLIHRDLKPANVLVQETGSQTVRAKLIDFGLARLHARGGGDFGTLMADPGALVGTPAFMAPEQAVNFHDADIRSDLYSLGCTFYFLLTGRLPFEARSCRAILDMHATRPVRPLRDTRPDVPAGLAAVVHRLMAKRPEDRYQTAEELCAALAALPPVTESGASRERHAFEPEPVSELGVTKAEPIQLSQGEPGPTCAGDEFPTDTSEPSADARLFWLEWCAVVEAQAQGQVPAVTAAQYADLYNQLTRSLRAAGTALAPLQSVVEPWVTLRALDGLDRKTIADLWETCQELEAAFAPSTPSVKKKSPFVLLLVLLVVGAGIGWALLKWPRLIALLGGAP